MQHFFVIYISVFSHINICMNIFIEYKSEVHIFILPLHNKNYESY